MINIIDSSEQSESIRNEIKSEVKGFIIRPSIALIDIKESEISKKYVEYLEKVCNKVGIYFRYYGFESDTPELAIINKIKELNNDDYVNGIMVNLPLPNKYNEKRIINSIINSKDVDGLTDINIGRLSSGRKTIVPTLSSSVINILKENMIELKQKNVVILGEYNWLSKSLMNIFLNENSIVTMCNKKENLENFLSDSDIIVNMFEEDNIIPMDILKDETVIVDAVFNSVNNTSKRFKNNKKNCTVITSSNIGNLSVSILTKNVILCYNNKK